MHRRGGVPFSSHLLVHGKRAGSQSRLPSRRTASPGAKLELGSGSTRTARPTAALPAQGGRGDIAFVEGQIPSVPARILSQCRVIVAGAGEEPSRIHLFEARAALLGLHRACSQRSLREKISVSLGDNTSEILSIESGRATNRALNAPCRQSLARQSYGDIDWRRPSAKNVADAASRWADAGLLSPGCVFTSSLQAIGRGAKGME